MELLIKVSRDTHPSIFDNKAFCTIKSMSVYSDEDLVIAFKTVYMDGTSGITRIKDIHSYDIVKLMIIYEYCLLHPNGHSSLLISLKEFYDRRAKDRLANLYTTTKKECDRLQDEYNTRTIGLDNLKLESIIALKKLMLYDACSDAIILIANFEYDDADTGVVSRLIHFFDSIKVTYNSDADMCISAYSYKNKYIYTYNTKTKFAECYNFTLFPFAIDNIYEFIMRKYQEAIDYAEQPLASIAEQPL